MRRLSRKQLVDRMKAAEAKENPTSMAVLLGKAYELAWKICDDPNNKYKVNMDYAGHVQSVRGRILDSVGTWLREYDFYISEDPNKSWNNEIDKLRELVVDLQYVLDHNELPESRRE